MEAPKTRITTADSSVVSRSLFQYQYRYHHRQQIVDECIQQSIG